MAVVERPVSVMEQSKFGKDIGEARPTEAMTPPVDARDGASPMPVREDRPKALGQLAIEIGHMSDDDVNVGDELLDFRPIDLLPLDHRICNAGQSRDGGRYRRRRLLECLKRVDDRDNSIICVCKLD